MQWQGTGFPLFIDINPGMNRTGLDQELTANIVDRARQIRETRCVFAGLHYYDGHLTDEDMQQRCEQAHAGYRALVGIVDTLQADGIAVPEVITAGTLTFPCSLSFEGFQGRSFRHTCSPGTIVYSDLSSLSKLPEDYGFRPAAVVLSRVISRPMATLVTLDAGHKAVSVDSGVPSCFVVELPNAIPMKPSEEHLPVDVSGEVNPPAVGTLLHLVPRHVCTTVNNFNHCVVIEGGEVIGVEDISARGRHAPLQLTFAG
jgi:D-serine deaminase-like pyridoxal phosphate-dependent protein